MSAGKPQEPPTPTKPGLADFDRWVQKRLIWTMGAVILVAFLFKTFVAMQFSFTIGLIVGMVVLLAVYLVLFYRRKP